ncbi:MAG TPA: hypothetical protein ENJ18_01070 [Nannocystis exedens]|nr:hypothetical protein [Nannocystis exedens]
MGVTLPLFGLAKARALRRSCDAAAKSRALEGF